jgi:hypothetical protein
MMRYSSWTWWLMSFIVAGYVDLSNMIDSMLFWINISNYMYITINFQMCDRLIQTVLGGIRDVAPPIFFYSFSNTKG